MTTNEYHRFNDSQLAVLAFLKNMKQYAPDSIDYLMYYGVSVKEMIKFMEEPERYGNFDFSFVCGLFHAIDKTYQHYLIEKPEIETQTEEDRILSSILLLSNHDFKSIYANERLINKSHLIAYLNRNNEIFDWNGWLVFIVQRKVEEIKAGMRFELENVG